MRSIDLLQRLDAIVWEADAHTLRFTFVTGGGVERLGYAPARWLGDPQFLVRHLHPADREATLALCQAVARDRRNRQIEHRIGGHDGRYRWFRTEVHASGDEALIGLMLDIDEVRSAQAKLRRAEDRLRQVVSNAPILLFALDRQGAITLWEGSGLAVNLPADVILGRSAFDVFRDEPGLIEHVHRALDGETFTAYDHVNLLGSWWETRWTPLRDAAGALIGSSTVALDVTDRRRTEDELANSMSLLRATLEATTDGILVVDSTHQRVLDFNRRFVEMWQIPEEVMATLDDHRMLAYVRRQIRDHELFLARVRALYADPEASSHDLIELKDGRIFERESQPQRVEGRAVGRVWSFRDVTVERRATRRANFLAEASMVLAGPLEDETTFEALARLAVPYLGEWCAIIVLAEEDRQPRVIAAHHVDESRIGLVWRCLPDLTPPPRGTALVLQTGEPLLYNDIRAEELTPSPPGRAPVSLRRDEDLEVLRRLELRAYMTVPLTVLGQALGAIIFASHDPDRRYSDEDLAVAQDLAQRTALAVDNHRLYRASKEAVQLRDEFLSVASHELRTPVTSLQLVVQSALTAGFEPGAPPGFLKQALESAERQTRRLGRLVDGLLNVSRIQAGRLELEREPVDLVALTREVLHNLREDLRRANCPVELRADAPVHELTGMWDRARIEQVLTNLVSNAAKYGAGKPIEITVARHGESAEWAVRDHGIGIAPERQAHIFDAFERAVSARHYGGLGLGLYIVRRILEAHGGAICVDSAPDQGATFIVGLPL